MHQEKLYAPNLVWDYFVLSKMAARLEPTEEEEGSSPGKGKKTFFKMSVDL